MLSQREVEKKFSTEVIDDLIDTFYEEALKEEKKRIREEKKRQREEKKRAEEEQAAIEASKKEFEKALALERKQARKRARAEKAALKKKLIEESSSNSEVVQDNNANQDTNNLTEATHISEKAISESADNITEESPSEDTNAPSEPVKIMTDEYGFEIEIGVVERIRKRKASLKKNLKTTMINARNALKIFYDENLVINSDTDSAEKLNELESKVLEKKEESKRRNAELVVESNPPVYSQEPTAEFLAQMESRDEIKKLISNIKEEDKRLEAEKIIQSLEAAQTQESNGDVDSKVEIQANSEELQSELQTVDEEKALSLSADGENAVDDLSTKAASDLKIAEDLEQTEQQSEESISAKRAINLDDIVNENLSREEQIRRLQEIINSTKDDKEFDENGNLISGSESDFSVELWGQGSKAESANIEERIKLGGNDLGKDDNVIASTVFDSNEAEIGDNNINVIWKRVADDDYDFSEEFLNKFAKDKKIDSEEKELNEVETDNVNDEIDSDFDESAETTESNESGESANTTSDTDYDDSDSTDDAIADNDDIIELEGLESSERGERNTSAYSFVYSRMNSFLREDVHELIKLPVPQVLNYVKSNYEIVPCFEFVDNREQLKDNDDIKSFKYSLINRIILGNLYPKKVLKVKDVKSNDKLWMILSFLFPYIGFILFALNKTNKPIKSAKCLKGSISAIYLILSLASLTFLYIYSFLPSIQSDFLSRFIFF